MCIYCLGEALGEELDRERKWGEKRGERGIRGGRRIGNMIQNSMSQKISSSVLGWRLRNEQVRFLSSRDKSFQTLMSSLIHQVFLAWKGQQLRMGPTNSGLCFWMEGSKLWNCSVPQFPHPNLSLDVRTSWGRGVD